VSATILVLFKLPESAAAPDAATGAPARHEYDLDRVTPQSVTLATTPSVEPGVSILFAGCRLPTLGRLMLLFRLSLKTVFAFRSRLGFAGRGGLREQGPLRRVFVGLGRRAEKRTVLRIICAFGHLGLPDKR